MSQEHDVDCPSGLSVKLREFRVSDEDLLADPKSQRRGLAITSLIDQITVGVNDPGPYALRDGKLDWNKVLQGDRMTVLLANRIATWGEEMDFKLPCPSCRQSVQIVVDLRDLEIKPLPDTSKPHAIDATKPLTCKLPSCGAVVSFRLLRGDDDRGLQKLQKQSKHNLSSAYLRFRVMEVAGVPGHELPEWLKNLGARDASYLRAEFDKQDCGVDQEIELECDACGHAWEEDVKLGADFLFPKYRGKT